MTTAVRLAHLSDIHLTARPLGWTWRDWLTKRLTGWFNNHWLQRSRRFRQADEVLAVLMAELHDRHRPDCVVFSGDATTLGFADELRTAAAVLRVHSADSLPGFAVPGNHDYYVPLAAASGTFEQQFAPWQQGERTPGFSYPFARRVGPLWLVGVNSCTGNRWPWDATGRVAHDQLQRLEQLLAGLHGGPRILVTHYPISNPAGAPVDPQHWLHNLADVVQVAQRGGVCLWLHGHLHVAYHLNDARVAPFPVICAGSATELGNWGYNVYTIEGQQLQAIRRQYRPEKGCFEEVDRFDLTLG